VSSDDGLPQRITAVRRKLGLPQRPFAVRIGVSRNAVIRHEDGRNRPRAETLDQIAKIGGVTVEWFLDGSRREHAAAGEERQWRAAVESSVSCGRTSAGAAVVLRLLRGLALLTRGRTWLVPELSTSPP